MLSPVDIPSILNDRQKWRKENPLYLVRLNSAQKRFMDCVTQDGKLPRRLIFCGCNKIGKCLRSVAPTPTPNGIVKFGSLKVGDEVFSQDGSVTRVTGVYPQGKRPMYKLRFTDGSWVIADLEHLWACYGRKERFGSGPWEPRIMTTRDLMETQDRWVNASERFSFPVAEPLQCPARELPINPYLLGLWFSEGNATGSVVLAIGDFDLVDQIKTIWPDMSVRQTKRSLWTVILRGATKLWRAVGLEGCVSYNKRIPHDYLFGSIEQRLELLRGILDGDGCVVPKGSVNGVEYSTASPYLAKAVKWLVQSLGGQVTVKLRRPWFTYKGERKKGKRSFRLFLSGLTMCPFRLKRKAKSWRPRESRTNQRVLRSITYWGEDEAVCIQVEHPSQLYLTRNCIVTHNTTMGAIRGTCLAIGEHPFLRDNHVFRDLRKSGWPLPNVGLVAGETLTQTINQKLAPEYLKWIPKVCEPTFKRNSLGVITEITIHKDLKGQPLGSKIFMRSYDSQADTYEGIDYNWIHWDEPPPNNVFVAAERGLIAMNGISYLTFTSLKEPWLNDLAAESIDYGGEDATVRVIESGDIWNALKENGGHLEREAIEAFIKVCPVEEYDARILGKWMESGGRIYGTFRDAFPYVLPPFEIPNDWQWYESVDPADGKHTKWLFVAVAPYDVSIFKQNVGRLFVADWLSFPPGTLITDMVKMVKRKRIELDYEEPSMVVLDAKFGRRRTTAFDRNEPQRWDEKLIEAGVGYVKLSHSAPGDVDVGHNVVREYLKPQLWSFAMQEDAQEVPGLVFFSTCRGKGGPIEAMLKYKRQMKSDKPEETYKDWPDAIRYVCMEYPKVMRLRTKRSSSESGKPRNRFTGV